RSDARARIVGTAGSSFDLLPSVVQGNVPIVIAFDKPDVVLPPGDGYSVAVDGLVDLAGNSGGSGTPPRLGSIDAGPLVPEDGFESVTGPTFGGAGVVRSGPLLPIAGAQSLYVGDVSSPGHDLYLQGPQLLARLAMQPGDTKLRFTYRTVSSVASRVF